MSCETPFPHIPNGFGCKVSFFRSAYPNTDSVCLYGANLRDSSLQRSRREKTVGIKRTLSFPLSTVQHAKSRKTIRKSFRFKLTFIRTHVHAHIGQSPVSFGVTLEEGGGGSKGENEWVERRERRGERGEKGLCAKIPGLYTAATVSVVVWRAERGGVWDTHTRFPQSPLEEGRRFANFGEKNVT